jgi:6-phosphogluconolactonase/glucosamine-6-phosphate isomerase/deaminase
MNYPDNEALNLVSPVLTPTLNLFKPTIIQFESLDLLYKNFISHLSDRVLEIGGEYGTTRLGLSGNAGLMDMYKLIGQNYSFPFEEVEIYQLDEDIQGSRQLRIKQLLGENIDMAKFCNWVTVATMPKMIASLSEEFDQFDEDDSLDVCVVEIDNQGQILGLISRGEGLKGDSAIAVSNMNYTMDSYGLTTRQELVSISMPTLLQAKEIICLLKDDTEIMDEILSGSRSAIDCPAKMLLAHPKVTIFYYLDI